MPLSVRLGAEHVARAQQLARELRVPVAEVYRRALHGQARLGAAPGPYRSYPLRVTPSTLAALRARVAGGDVAPEVRAIFSGDSEHL